MNPLQFAHAAESFLAFIQPRVERNTWRTLKYLVTHWMRAMPRCNVETIQLEAYRNQSLKNGVAPKTIEAVVSAVRQVAAFAGMPIDGGRRLIVPSPSPHVVECHVIDQIIAHVSIASWPTRLTSDDRSRWWRCYVALSCWSALRLGDVSRLMRSDVTDTHLRINASKTRRFRRPETLIPLRPWLASAIAASPALHKTKLIGLTSSHKQLRRELAAIASAAGVEYVSPQGFRRFAISQWSQADSLAGQIIQGQAVGAIKHYVCATNHLAHVAPSVRMPRSLTGECSRTDSEEGLLLSHFRAATQDNRELIVRVARSVS